MPIRSTPVSSSMPRCLTTLHGVVVTGPDADLVARESFGNVRRRYAVMGQRYRRHPPTHPVGIGDAVNGSPGDGLNAVDQSGHQARLVVDCGPVGGFDAAASRTARRSPPRPASRSTRRTRPGPRAARSVASRFPICRVTRPWRTAPGRRSSRRGAVAVPTAPPGGGRRTCTTNTPGSRSRGPARRCTGVARAAPRQRRSTPRPNVPTPPGRPRR